MAKNQDDNFGTLCPDAGDGKLRSLLSLFNWLVGEVMTARVMTLRLAADLVRLGIMPVEELNGTPLSKEIIDSVLGHFPQDPAWRPIGQRLRDALESLRSSEAEAAQLDQEDDWAAIDDDLDGLDDDDDLAALLNSEVLYQHPGHERAAAEASLRARLTGSAQRKN